LIFYIKQVLHLDFTSSSSRFRKLLTSLAQAPHLAETSSSPCGSALFIVIPIARNEAGSIPKIVYNFFYTFVA
jgi:hypothetical protein